MTSGKRRCSTTGPTWSGDDRFLACPAASIGRSACRLVALLVLNSPLGTEANRQPLAEPMNARTVVLADGALVFVYLAWMALSGWLADRRYRRWLQENEREP